MLGLDDRVVRNSYRGHGAQENCFVERHGAEPEDDTSQQHDVQTRGQDVRATVDVDLRRFVVSDL